MNSFFKAVLVHFKNFLVLLNCLRRFLSSYFQFLTSGGNLLLDLSNSHLGLPVLLEDPPLPRNNVFLGHLNFVFVR